MKLLLSETKIYGMALNPDKFTQLISFIQSIAQDPVKKKLP
jgi:hypothetical protein